MAFLLEDDGSQNQGGSQKIATGVFANKLTVVSIEDKSSYPNKEKHFFKSGKETELYLVVTCQREGGDKEKLLHLMGHYKKDQVTGKITGWDGFNNGVQQFMVRLGKDIASVNDDFSIDQSTLGKYIGKEFISVNYCSGTYQGQDGSDKVSYTDWRVFPADTTTDYIQNEWGQSAQYLSRYKPEIYEAYEKSKPAHTSSGESSTPAATDIKNDDLPF